MNKKVFVACWMHVDDDWKRAEKSMGVVGVFDNEERAYQAAFEDIAGRKWNDVIENNENKDNTEDARERIRNTADATWQKRLELLEAYYEENRRQPEFLTMCAGYSWAVFEQELQLSESDSSSLSESVMKKRKTVDTDIGDTPKAQNSDVEKK